MEGLNIKKALENIEDGWILRINLEEVRKSVKTRLP